MISTNIMISKLIESFATEIQKEETQEYINTVIEPYLCKYNYYLYLITLMFFIMMLSTLYNSVCLYKYVVRKVTVPIRP